MRKVRDYDAELKALEERARGLKARRIEQLGALVTATGADALDLEMLAGALLDAVSSNDTVAKEAWRVKGAAFFQRRSRKASPKAGGDDNSRAPHSGVGLASDRGTTSD